MESLVQMAVEDHVRHIRSLRDAFAQSLYAVTLGVWDASPGMPQPHPQLADFKCRLIPAAEVDIRAFSGDASLLRALTAVRAAVDVAFVDIVPGPPACLVCGVSVAAAELAGPRHIAGNLPTMVVLTDGRSNPSPASSAAATATPHTRQVCGPGLEKTTALG